MKKNRFILIFTAFIILAICALTVQPEKHIPAEWDKTVITSLLSSEEIMIGSAKIRIDTYFDKGVKLCAAVLTEEKVPDMADETNKKALMQAMENALSDENTGGEMYENSDKVNGGKCETYHKGVWSTENGVLKSQNTIIYGIINENRTAKMMLLSQVIENDGVALKVKTPAGFEMRSDGSYMWQSEQYNDVLMMCAYTGDIEISSLTGMQRLTINSGMEIYPDDVSAYLSEVSDSREMMLFIAK